MRKRTSWITGWLWGAALICAGIVAYANSFQGVFVQDDEPAIVENAQIKTFPSWDFLKANRRPVLYLSLALNEYAGGLNPWGYHLVNLMIHLLAALVLMAVIRRTLRGCASEKIRSTAEWTAGGTALLWLVHPLQTATVTYVVQRAEALAGLFYLLTLYASLRRFTAGTRPWPWTGAAAVFCLLGMLSKEVMVTAPLVIWIYDVLFISRSWTMALRRHRDLYAALGLGWSVFAALLMFQHPEAVPSAGFGLREISPWHYLLTQAQVIPHYLLQAVLLRPLVLNYADWPVVQTVSQVWLPGLLLLGALGLVVWACLRKKPWGFLGAWFFLILAPTSSFMPIADVAFDHRMYLPLAAVMAALVLGLVHVAFLWVPQDGGRRFLSRAVIVMMALLGIVLTQIRNVDYHSELGMWQDAARKRPANAMAHTVIGVLHFEAGDLDEAGLQYKAALELKPEDPVICNDMGLLLVAQGHYAEAEYYYRKALDHPSAYDALIHNNIGVALAHQGRYPEALAHYQEALRLGYGPSTVFSNIGIAYVRQGQHDKGVKFLRQALEMDPANQEAEEVLREATQALLQAGPAAVEDAL